ncbi:MAG TPA: CHAT domain-containing protein, partial [Steroidobacteraceae bacterium]
MSQDVIDRAQALVIDHEFGAAKRLLLGLLNGADGNGDGRDELQVLRLLAICHRQDRELEEARNCASRALALAERLGSPAAVAVMFESLALIESADGAPRAAGAYFWRSAETERMREEPEGQAAALGNYAHMLLVNESDGGERLLELALDAAPPGGLACASAIDNMASELERQGRHAEALVWGERAVDAFRALGEPNHLYTALRNYARHLRNNDQDVEANRVFEEAHSLIHSIRRGDVDKTHYAAYAERVAAIEAHSQAVVERTDPGEAWLQIGLHATLGEEALDRALVEIENGQFAKAIELLEASRAHWLALEAQHYLVRVDYHLALAYLEIGAMQKALPLAYRVRAQARELGDAHRESLALWLLIRLRDLLPTEDPLDHLAQEHALREVMALQLGLDPSTPQNLDDGVMASLAASICAEAHAFEMAESYLRESLSIGEGLPESMRYRLVYRLNKLYMLLTRAGEHERASAALAELQEVASQIPSDPRVERATVGLLARRAFREGDRSADTYTGLLEECRAYGQLRDQARGAELGGFAEVMDPPYLEAAEVALALNRPKVALQMLELGRARTLIERLGLPMPELPALADEDPFPPDIGDALGLELFVMRSGVSLFAVDGRSAEVGWSELQLENDHHGRSLVRAIRAFVDAGDTARGSGVVNQALQDVMNHPAFRTMCDELLSKAGKDRTVWLVPHRWLHSAPFQLASSVSESSEGTPWSVVPALAVVSRLPRHAPTSAGSALVVCGDPLGDLQFARIEARLVAGEDPTLLALGEACHADWLRERCTGREIGVLHLACHGRFDGKQPERGGLVLAAPDMPNLAGTQAARTMQVAEI